MSADPRVSFAQWARAVCEIAAADPVVRAFIERSRGRCDFHPAESGVCPVCHDILERRTARERGIARRETECRSVAGYSAPDVAFLAEQMISALLDLRAAGVMPDEALVRLAPVARELAAVTARPAALASWLEGRLVIAEARGFARGYSETPKARRA